jgi:drug/metabolite transporter (DMT)-like permease
MIRPAIPGAGGLSPRDILLALACPTAMAAGFVAAKAVLDVMPPIMLSAVRHTIAAAVLIWFVPPPWGSMWRLFGVTFVAATIQFCMTYAAMSHLDVATGTLLVQSEVPFAIIIAAIVNRRMLSRLQIVGTCLGMLGTLLVFGTPSVQGNYGAAVMLILASLVWAIGQNMVATLTKVAPFQLATWLAVFATIQLWPISLIVDGNPLPHLAMLDRWNVGALLVVGIGPSIIGYGLWCSLIGRHGIVKLAPFLLTIPVIAIGLGVWLLGERLTTLMVIGGAVTLVGVTITLERIPVRRLRSLPIGKDV